MNDYREFNDFYRIRASIMFPGMEEKRWEMLIEPIYGRFLDSLIKDHDLHPPPSWENHPEYIRIQEQVRKHKDRREEIIDHAAHNLASLIVRDILEPYINVALTKITSDNDPVMGVKQP